MNSIAEKLADFLKKHSPFDLLTSQELDVISKNIRVINLEVHNVLFQTNDELHTNFYVVASGLINLTVISQGEEIILNKCHQGAIFGLAPFFKKNNYLMNAKAREETLVFGIPIAIFQPLVANNQTILNLLLEKFSINTASQKANNNISAPLLTPEVNYAEQQTETHYFQSLSYNVQPVIVSPKNKVKEVVIRMVEAQNRVAIVCEDNVPVGMVCEGDLISKIVIEKIALSAQIGSIMNTDIVTVLEDVSLVEAQLLMLKHAVSYLCVTLDGSNKSILKGVISERDLIIAQSNNPGILIQEIKNAQEALDLKRIREKLIYLVRVGIQKNAPLVPITSILSEINTLILSRVIEISLTSLPFPPSRFAWLSVGSQARKEQTIASKQDSILIFEDVLPEKYIEVKGYFLNLGNQVSLMLKEIGYELGTNELSIGNSAWCKSQSDWNNLYQKWMNTPAADPNIRSFLFDFELVYGEQNIKDSLSNLIYKNENNTLIFDYLGNETTRNNAPLTFFKKFHVEEEGSHKDKFDIKKYALTPLINGARLFALSTNTKGITNTYLRFKQLAIALPQQAEIFTDCAEAFLVLLKYRSIEGIKNDNSGQYINLMELSKSDKEKLKNALAPMIQLEELIKDTFQLTQFS